MNIYTYYIHTLVYEVKALFDHLISVMLNHYYIFFFMTFHFDYGHDTRYVASLQ